MTDDLPLDDLLASWTLSLAAAGRRQRTLDAYETGVRAYLAWAEANGAAPLARDSLRAWTATLLAGGSSPATAQLRQGSVRRFASWLLEEDEIAFDPFSGIKPPRTDEKVIQPLSADEIRAMLNACQIRAGMTPEMKFLARRDEALLRLLFEAGLRAGEALALDLTDVDLRAGIATIQRSKTHRGRIVPFGPQTASAIDRYLRARRSYASADSQALWVGRRGLPLKYKGLATALARRAQDAGVAGWHAHRARHSFACRWLSAGGSESTLQSVAGWAGPRQMQHYTRARAAERAVAEARGLGLGDI